MITRCARKIAVRLQSTQTEKKEGEKSREKVKVYSGAYINSMQVATQKNASGGEYKKSYSGGNSDPRSNHFEITP